jgi:two-component system sensor histidine kinase NreB
LETTIYRLVQEALTNVVKHAGAQTVHVLVVATESEITVEVRDDGRGFDTGARSDGFGLAGLRERVYLTGGTLELKSGGEGTQVRAELPIRRAADQPGGSRADQLAS